MFINGAGTALPGNAFTQAQCWEAFQQSPQFGQLSGRSHAILRKVLLGNNGIDRRFLSLDKLSEAFALSPDVLHARFSAAAPVLAEQAARAALAQAALQPREVGALLVSTCTGYLCPGLTSYVSERLGLPNTILNLDLVGQGCGAALPNLRAAEALIHSGQSENVLSICVEVCSAAFYLDNDPGVLVSACLFGDGAAAVVSSRKPNPNAPVVEWTGFGTLLDTRERDLLRFEQKGGMLRNILDKSVPLVVVENARQVWEQVSARHGLSKSDISAWLFHSGGRDILAALQSGFGLAEEDLRWSAGVLRRFGNMSSPSVWFALADALAGGQPGGLWWMSSFGAGLACHGALLRVTR